MPSRAAATAVLALSVGLAAAACSTTDAAVPATTDLLAPRASTPTVPATLAPTGPPSFLPTVQAGACPALAAVPSPLEVVDDVADVDGDGTTDQLTTYRSAAGPWHLRAALASGGGADVTIAPATAVAVAVLGGTQVDGVAGDDVLISSASAPTGATVSLVRFGTCELIPTQRMEGATAAFPVGATDTLAQGLECRTPDIVVKEAASTDGRHFTTSDVTLAFVGDRLVEIARATGVLDAEAERDRYLTYLELRCGGLQLLED